MKLQLVADTAARPRTRGDCVDGPRPCPWADCRYHLEHAVESCALDVADRGPSTDAEIAELLGMPKRTVCWTALEALRSLRTRAAALHDELGRAGPSRTVEARVLAALESGPLTVDDLDGFGANRRAIENLLQKLRRAGVASCSGRGSRATWSLVGDVEEAA